MPAVLKADSPVICAPLPSFVPTAVFVVDRAPVDFDPARVPAENLKARATVQVREAINSLKAAANALAALRLDDRPTDLDQQLRLQFLQLDTLFHRRAPFELSPNQQLAPASSFWVADGVGASSPNRSVATMIRDSAPVSVMASVALDDRENNSHDGDRGRAGVRGGARGGRGRIISDDDDVDLRPSAQKTGESRFFSAPKSRKRKQASAFTSSKRRKRNNHTFCILSRDLCQFFFFDGFFYIFPLDSGRRGL